MTDFLRSNVQVPCPECGRAITVRLRDAQNRRRARCALGHQVQLVEKGHGLRDVDRALRKLDRAVRRLGGRLTFKP